MVLLLLLLLSRVHVHVREHTRIGEFYPFDLRKVRIRIQSQEKSSA